MSLEELAQAPIVATTKPAVTTLNILLIRIPQKMVNFVTEAHLEMRVCAFPATLQLLIYLVYHISGTLVLGPLSALPCSPYGIREQPKDRVMPCTGSRGPKASPCRRTTCAPHCCGRLP